jgi:signal transduction histidine kinase
MLTLTVANQLETQQLTHDAGPLEIGRGPARADTPRVVVRDAFVSRDHARIEERPGRKVRVVNLSTKAAITADSYATLAPGADCEYLLPVRLALGETVVDVDSGDAEPVSASVLRTVSAPVRGTSAKHPALIDRSESSPPEDVVGWLESVVAVQKAGERAEFFNQTAQALVEQIGLDTGMVLVRDGSAWRVMAQAMKGEPVGRAFSHGILNQVLAAKRTFFVGGADVTGGESLVGVSGVVASPFFDAKDEIVGIVYGTRAQRATGREIGALEAQVVQLLAAAVGAGLQRLERIEEANRLRVAKEAAEEADRTKTGFLAMVSHELRTPLTTIIGYSEMLLEQAEADNLPQYAADLKQVHSAGQHLFALINDILDYSQIEAGKLELAKDPYAPASLIRDVMASAEPLAKKNNNALEVDCPAHLDRGVGDPARVRQCVLNLVGNACKFTKDGAVKVTARRVTVDGADMLRVDVTDTGIGMTLEQVGKLFQAFQQADGSTSRKYGGTGLGLAISQKLAQAMGGDITVTSEPGKGSTFTLTIKAVL